MKPDVSSVLQEQVDVFVQKISETLGSTQDIYVSASLLSCGAGAQPFVTPIPGAASLLRTGQYCRTPLLSSGSALADRCGRLEDHVRAVLS